MIVSREEICCERISCRITRVMINTPQDAPQQKQKRPPSKANGHTLEGQAIHDSIQSFLKRGEASILTSESRELVVMPAVAEIKIVVIRERCLTWSRRQRV